MQSTGATEPDSDTAQEQDFWALVGNEEVFISGIEAPGASDEKADQPELGGVGVDADLMPLPQASVTSPCFFIEDECQSDKRIDIGVMEAHYYKEDPPGRVARAENAYANVEGTCGWGFEAGFVSWSNDQYFVIFSHNTWLFDTAGVTDGGKADFRIYCYEYDQQNCTGDYRYVGSETEYCDSTEDGGGNPVDNDIERAAADSKADCAGGYGDPASECNMPDFIVYRSGEQPEQPIWKSYNCQLRARACDDDSTNCTTDYAWGCFDVRWLP